MSGHVPLGFYDLVRGFIGLALGFYFRRIERFHSQRVPLSGPVLFTSNHPNSLTDSFVIGTAVARRVNFVATVQLFRAKPLKWLLSHCGVIPINRVKDDPRAMRTIADTFEACFGVLEKGEAVGIFPEGITYDDSQLKQVKSGAARMALELEHRHQGKLGLQIVPVGLTYSRKEMYRSDALVNFGEPIRVADFVEGYGERRKECISALTAEIERRIQGLIVHLPQLEHAQVIDGVKRLYFDEIWPGQGGDPGLSRRSVLSQAANGGQPLSGRAEELLLTQRIVEAVEHVYQTEPERAAAFAARLAWYERWLGRLRISEENLAALPHKRRLIAQSFVWALVALVGAPIAVYGWAHRIIPYTLVKWAAARFAEPGKKKAQRSTVAIVAGIVGFGLFYGFCILLVQLLFGWPVSLWYGLSLPIASLLAHYYVREVRRLLVALRDAVILLRARVASRRLLRVRAGLIAEIDQVRHELRSRPELAQA
jgi:glycerol-3-phosphate O-acyltransferase / dihydroxyacetone phosphate acyltransferase